MKKWGISVEHLGLRPAAATPVIVEQIVRTKDGGVRHRFQFNCPRCGGYFPTFRPLREETALEFIQTKPAAEVFFADRVSSGILILAEYFRSSGALIVFEPSGTGNENHFRRMLEMADIVKYSHDRAANFVDVLQSAKPALQIETLGAGGIQYCRRQKRRSRQCWQQLPAFSVAHLKDTAGSGDWTTAGLIARVASGGKGSFVKMTQADVTEALRYAQAAAAWNGAFEGPRGGMYEQSRKQFDLHVGRILRKVEAYESTELELSLEEEVAVCADCSAFFGKPVARVTTSGSSTQQKLGLAATRNQ